MDKVKKGKERVVNATFAVMRAQNLSMPVSAKYLWLGGGRSGEECPGQLVRDLDQGQPATLRLLHQTQRLPRCPAPFAVRLDVSPKYARFSAAKMLEHEWSHLLPLLALFEGCLKKSARVLSTSLVAVAPTGSRLYANCGSGGEYAVVRNGASFVLRRSLFLPTATSV